LQYAESGPSFFQRVSAAKAFGVVDGWGAYSLTEQGKKYFYPASPNEKKSAALFFLSMPAAFSIIVKRFDGDKLPPNDMVGNIMHNEAKVPDSWKDRLAGIFMRSAQFVGVLDSNGHLRCKAYLDALDDQDAPPPPPPPPPPDDEREHQPEKGHTMLPIPINVRTGRRATLSFPKDITNEEVGKLIDSIKLSFDYSDSATRKDAILRNPLGKEDSQ